MWYLVGPTGSRCYLTPEKTIKFGRKIGDVLLVNDPSISRLHASIFVSSIGNDKETSTCTICDLNSKYGTWVETGDKRIKVTSDGYCLRDQDEIQFGVLKQIYKVVCVPIIVVPSVLDVSQKIELQSIMDKIDGFVSDNWTKRCTHLTVSRAALTEKVACAMASAVPVVTMSYWKSVQVAVDKGNSLPNAEEFTPLIDESLLGKRKGRLEPNVKRRTLFRDMVFVHFSADQYSTYGKIIKLAGGKPVLYKSGCLTAKDLCASNVIVLQHPDSSMSQSTLGITNDYDVIYKLLEKKKRKMIPETDIPLAIWNCSIEKYCNPAFSFAAFLKRKQSRLPTAQVLVLDTQDVASNRRPLPKVVSDVPVASNISLKHAVTGHLIIPETCDEFSTQRVSTTDCVNDSAAAAEINEPRIIQETADTFADTSFTQKTRQVPEVSSTRENVYIPETNDSSFSNEINENAVHFEQDIENSLKQVHEMQVSTNDQEMVETNVKQESNVSITENLAKPVNNVGLNVNDDSEVQIMNWVSDADQNYNNLRSSTPKKEEKKSPVKLNTKIVEERKKKFSPVPGGSQESHKRTMGTARCASENDSDEECIPFAKKDISLENSGISMEGHETADNSGRETSLLRINSKSKRFCKVHKKIPNTRIALDDMYAWDVCSSTK